MINLNGHSCSKHCVWKVLRQNGANGLRDLFRGSVGIGINDDITHYFRTMKGLIHRRFVVTVLFNIVADMLSILIAKAKENGQVGGLIPHLVEGDTHLTICQRYDYFYVALLGESNEHEINAMHIRASIWP